MENSREVVTQDKWKEKLMTFPDVFADVFSELASQPPKKKNKGDDDWKGGSGSGKNKVPAPGPPTIDSLYFRTYNS